MGGSSKTTQENKPPAWAEPLFKQSASVASNIYNSGLGGNTYTGSTVAPLSSTTLSGINQLAQAGANYRTDQTRPLYQQIGAASVGPSAADNYLTGYASGDYLNGEGNPFYRNRLNSEIADANSIIRSQFSGMGRTGGTGSGGEYRAIADNTSNMLLKGLEDDYNRQQANQLAAVGMIDQNRNAGLDRALQSTGAMTDLDQQQFQNRLTGAGATLQAGGIVDDQAQKQLSDRVNAWYAADNAPWTRLGLLQAAASGAAGPYGTQVATTRQSPGLSGILSGVGGLFSGK
jgi:hypothetical protein